MPIKHKTSAPTVFDRNYLIRKQYANYPFRLSLPEQAGKVTSELKFEMPICKQTYLIKSLTLAASILMPGPMVVEMAIPLR
jgi:hypothetical protein